MSSSFSTRNTYYLRISRDTVLSLYAYIEEPYVGWMSDYILQKVLTSIKPLIRPKLEAEAMADKKTSSVPEVIIGDDYRFCFFFKATSDRHVVLLKDRHYVARTLPAQDPVEESSAPSAPADRKMANGRKRVREESEEVDEDFKPELQGRSPIDDFLASGHAERDAPANQALFDYGEEPVSDDEEREVHVKEEGYAAGYTADEILDAGEEEKKFKPALEMHYKGFSIYSFSLNLIIEPYPLPTPQHAFSLRRSSSVSLPPTPRPRAGSTFSSSTMGTRRTFERTPSASPWPSIPAANSRSASAAPPAEPLFRPMTPMVDEDAEEEERREEERRRKWASWRDRSLSVLPSREESAVPGEGVEEGGCERDGGGMANLTQSLINVGGRQGVGEGEDVEE